MSDAPERLKNKVAIAHLINDLQDNDYESSLIIADAIIDEIPPTREQIMADPRVMALVEAVKQARRNLQHCMGDSDSMAWCIVETETQLIAALAALTDNEGETE